MTEREIDKAIQRISKTFKALSNPIRLRILLLCAAEEKTSRELREALGISKPLLIAHLKKLLSTGLLEYRVEMDERKMIVRKYYKTKTDALCVTEMLKALDFNPESGERLKS